MEFPVDASLCVNRVLSLTPADAEVALALCEPALTTAASGQGGRVVIALTGGTAELRPAPLSGTSKGSRRRLVGVLRSQHRWFAVPVEVEVAPRKSGPLLGCGEPDRAELRVRPIGPSCLRSLTHHRLFVRLAPVLAERVALELECAAQVACA